MVKGSTCGFVVNGSTNPIIILIITFKNNNSPLYSLEKIIKKTSDNTSNKKAVANRCYLH